MDTETEPIRVPSGPVQVNLNFFEPPADGSAPYQYAGAPPAGLTAANYGQPAIPLILHDIRDDECEYSLDHDAFQPLQNVFATIPHEVFDSDEEVQKGYYPAVEELLLSKIEGAHKIIVFDHVIRREQDNTGPKPLHTAHADQTAKAAETRVRLSVSDETEAEELLRGRYRIVNVWKPLNGPVNSSPLAFARGSSVEAADLVPIEFRLPQRTGEIVGVRYNPDQKWMYWSGMRNDECMLLKCNDSKDGVAKQVPHSAFVDPRTPPGIEGRESIEVRALVFG